MPRSKRQRSHPTHVFINCPFDLDYESIFNAIVFAILDCGFNPRSAKERSDSAEVRISKIQTLIAECRFGIHDISRVEIGGTGLPRFNMPYEMGLFIGCKEYGGPSHASKCALVLDSKPFRYRESVSDIAGQDIRSHDNKPAEAIRCIRNWLSDYSAVPMPSASTMIERYLSFQQELAELSVLKGWNPNELTYSEYLYLVNFWLKANERTLFSED